jgi:SAM-dependent methyltransferase
MTSKQTGGDPTPAAIARTAELFRPSFGSRWRTVSGHIDLLGEEEPIGPAFLQRAMGSRLIPRIYERLWRPIASRFFFGMWGPTPAHERRMALEMLAISPGDQVLDIGCGPGNFTRSFVPAAEPGLVVGFDASRTMLAAAARREVGPNLAYVRGDARALPFADAEFDAVCCFGTLHLLDDPLAALDEMARVLVPDGRLALMATWSRRERSPRRLQGARIFGREELTGALAARGFVDVKQRVAGWGQFVAARRRGRDGDV